MECHGYAAAAGAAAPTTMLDRRVSVPAALCAHAWRFCAYVHRPDADPEYSHSGEITEKSPFLLPTLERWALVEASDLDYNTILSRRVRTFES